MAELCAFVIVNAEALEAERDDLARRVKNQKAWYRAFASCLDGLPLPNIGGRGIDGCRDHREIRRIVEHLLDQLNVKDHSPIGAVSASNPGSNSAAPIG